MDRFDLIDPAADAADQIERQSRIIDALARRAMRQNSFGDSAFSLFQSAVALQEQVRVKTLDLERASHELETLRFDLERSRLVLADALSVMEGGFALFAEGRLVAFNDFFKTLLPDRADALEPGLAVQAYYDMVVTSRYVVEADGLAAGGPVAHGGTGPAGRALARVVVGLLGNRWVQFSQQHTVSDNLIIFQTDITDIVRANQREKDQLIDMQARYLQATFDHMSSGVGSFSRSGRLQIHNDRFQDLIGLPDHLVAQGTRFAEILGFLRESQAFAATELEEVSEWRRILSQKGYLRKRLPHVSGTVLDFRLNLLPDLGFQVDIADATLEAQSTELLARSVAERTTELTEVNERLTRQFEHQARVEEELRLAKERAEAAVSSKTRFLAAASHDLLQPMNAAKLLLSSLSEAARSSNHADMVDRLQRSYSSMESLLQALLDISRLESAGGELSPTDFPIGPLIASVLEDQAPVAAQKGLELRGVTCSAWVRSDQRYLWRSIQNLMVNALQYTETGKVLVGCRRRGDVVVLEVWDTGIGITAEDQRHIFDEFARGIGQPQGSGMGLGLSIVERTCRQLGHRLTVRSDPGVGSVFRIELPCVSVAPEERSRGKGALLEVVRNPSLNLLVLVIENDPDLLFATVTVLEEWGASVFGTRTKAEALEVVRDIGIPPDIIIADYHLDDGDTGTDAIACVRDAVGVPVPSVLITANRTAQVLRLGETQGITVMFKPVDLPRLRRILLEQVDPMGLAQVQPVA